LFCHLAIGLINVCPDPNRIQTLMPEGMRPEPNDAEDVVTKPKIVGYQVNAGGKIRMGTWQ
jgi:hypothetical protein